MQQDKSQDEEKIRLFQVSLPTYIMSTIAIIVGLANLVRGIGWNISDTPFNLTLAIFNLLILIAVLFFFFKSYYVFYKLDEVCKVPSDVWIESMGEEKVRKSIKIAKQLLWYCRNIWLTIIVGWIILYLFVLMSGLGYIGLATEMRNLILRVYNYIDTVQFLLLYSFFSYAKPTLEYNGILSQYKWIYYVFFFIVTLDIVLFNTTSSSEIGLVFNAIGGFLSAVTFLMFFARLDSTFIQLSKFMLSLLVLYGIYQAFYPLMLSNDLVYNSSILSNFIYIVGFITSAIGKIYLAILFSSTRYLERFIYYFSGIYFLAPFTKYNLSIGHTFYAVHPSEDVAEE